MASIKISDTFRTLSLSAYSQSMRRVFIGMHLECYSNFEYERKDASLTLIKVQIQEFQSWKRILFCHVNSARALHFWSIDHCSLSDCFLFSFYSSTGTVPMAVALKAMNPHRPRWPHLWLVTLRVEVRSPPWLNLKVWEIVNQARLWNFKALFGKKPTKEVNFLSINFSLYLKRHLTK